MKKLGLKAVYPAKKTTKTDRKYKPMNLLKNFRMRKPNDVWFMDITYVRSFWVIWVCSSGSGWIFS